MSTHRVKHAQEDEAPDVLTRRRRRAWSRAALLLAGLALHGVGSAANGPPPVRPEPSTGAGTATPAAPLVQTACGRGAMPTVESPQIAWLKAGHFAQLDAHLGAAQAAWKAGRIDDLTLLRAFRPFRDPDPALQAHYAAWIAASPNSYVARVAQGFYDLQVGRAARGCATRGQATESQLRAMDAANDLARQALTASLAFDSRPLLSYVQLIELARHDGHDDGAELLAAANRIAPKNFIARRKYMAAMSTRWGGDTARMSAFLDECRTAGLEPAKLRALELLVERDRAWVASGMGDVEQAAAHGAAAVALVDDGHLIEDSVLSGLLQETGFAFEQLQRFDRACTYLQRAADIDPTSRWTWGHLASCQRMIGQAAASVASFRHGADLGDPYCEDELGKLLWYGTAQVKQDRTAAIAWLEKAAASNFPEAIRNLAWARRMASATPEPK